MARYFIESVQYGEDAGGIACGPVSGALIAEAKILSDTGEVFFMSLADVMGIPNFIKSPVSTFDLQIRCEPNDEEIEQLLSWNVDTGEYYEIFENRDPEWFQLYRYLIYIISAGEDSRKTFMSETSGRYLDEIDIPVSSIEEDYIDEEYEDCEDYADDED